MVKLPILGRDHTWCWNVAGIFWGDFLKEVVHDWGWCHIIMTRFVSNSNGINFRSAGEADWCFLVSTYLFVRCNNHKCVIYLCEEVDSVDRLCLSCLNVLWCEVACSWLILVQVPLYLICEITFLFLSQSHGSFQLQQDGNSWSRLGLTPGRPTHWRSWLGPCEDLPFRPVFHTTYLLSGQPGPDHHCRCTFHTTVWTHYAPSAVSQFLRCLSPMPRPTPRVSLPRNGCDLDTQDLVLPSIPEKDWPYDTWSMPCSRMPTATSPWLGTLWTRCLSCLGTSCWPILLVHSLLPTTQCQRQTAPLHRALPGHCLLLETPGLPAIRILHQTCVERDRWAPAHLSSWLCLPGAALCRQLLWWWPCPTTTCTTPTKKPDSTSTSPWTIPTCSRCGQFPTATRTRAAQSGSTTLWHRHPSQIPPTHRVQPPTPSLFLPSTQVQSHRIQTTCADSRRQQANAYHQPSLHSHCSTITCIYSDVAWSPSRPMGRRLRWTSDSTSQPPSLSSTQLATFHGPPDQHPFLASQLFHTTNSQSILPWLCLILDRRWTVRPFCQLADAYPPPGRYILRPSPDLQWSELLSYHDVVGHAVPTDLPPSQPTRILRTDPHHATANQYSRPRGGHSDQLLLHQDEPGTSRSIPEPEQRSFDHH